MEIQSNIFIAINERGGVNNDRPVLVESFDNQLACELFCKNKPYFVWTTLKHTQNIEVSDSLEDIALDMLKREGYWNHLYTFGKPTKPYPTLFNRELHLVILGLIKADNKTDISKAIQLAHEGKIDWEASNGAEFKFKFSEDEILDYLKNK